jgi:hypothetical protein
MFMKRRMLIAGLAVGMSFPVLAADQSNDAKETVAPRLGEIMVATQLRHFKLWYAGRVGNWDLARYELAQIKNAFSDATRFYPNTREGDMTALEQPTDEISKAIEAKDNKKFMTAYQKLTLACNSCHAALNLGFIRIREPRVSPIETSPFSDQQFSPE